MKFTLGADPECFLVNANGTPVPCINVIGGTKDNPRKYSIGHVQEDNVAVEFNIPPATNRKEFDSYIGTMLNAVRRLASRNGYAIELSSYCSFNLDELEHPQARTLGCDPDFNAWTMRPNPIQYAHVLKNIRVAGGHIHIGIPDIKKRPPTYVPNIVKALDFLLAAPLMLIDPDATRRRFYGRAGSYRPKPYGLEYRTPSNVWIRSSALRKYVYDRIDFVLENGPNRVSEWAERNYGYKVISAIVDNNLTPTSRKSILNICHEWGIKSPEGLP